MQGMRRPVISAQSDKDLQQQAPAAASNVVRIDEARANRPPPDMPDVRFDRRELDQILRVYGFMVAGGEWRDYGISHLKDRAVFSVYRRTSEMPLYRIEKSPKNARRQGAYSVVNASGMVLKRGHDLGQVLKMFDRQISLVQST